MKPDLDPWPAGAFTRDDGGDWYDGNVEPGDVDDNDTYRPAPRPRAYRSAFGAVEAPEPPAVDCDSHERTT